MIIYQLSFVSLITVVCYLGVALVPATCTLDYCQSCFSKHDASRESTIPPSVRIAIIIGCQKCGTTFMHASLIRQPGVAAAINKELHYLDRRQESHVSTTGYIARWKSKALALAKKDPALRGKPLAFMLDGKVLLEATPGYSVVPCAACRLVQWAPHARVIMMIREPVSRAVSHFEHCQRAHVGCLGNAKTIDTFIGNELEDGEPLKCMNQSFFGAQLEAASGSSSSSSSSSSTTTTTTTTTKDHRRMLATKAAVKAMRNATSQQQSDALLPPETWQACFQGCVFASRKQGMRCPGIDQDVPVSRGLYVHQLRWWHKLFPNNLLVINYHRMMDDPHQEIRRALSFISSNSSTSEKESSVMEFLQTAMDEGGGDDDDDAQDEAEEAQAPAPQQEPVKLKKVPGVVKHERSEDVLHAGQEVLHRMDELYRAHNAGLAELLKEMGQGHAMYNSSVVFPDPWEDLKLARRSNKS